MNPPPLRQPRLRPLLATRPGPHNRPSSITRALFALHLQRPELVAAWHKGDTLDTRRAQTLWRSHPWQLIEPPADVVALLERGEPLAP